MEIVKKKSSLLEFRVEKHFRWGGYTTAIGQTLSLNEPTATALVLSGHVSPIYPEELECMCLADIRLPGRDEAHTAKKNERVLLKKAQALSLMISRSVIPCDPDVWRPYGMQLRSISKRRAKQGNPVRFERPDK